MTFWTDDYNDESIKTPKDILIAAGDELESRTSRLRTKVLHRKLSDRIVLQFEVYNTTADRSLILFEVNHRIDECYPAAIIPPVDRTPEFLKEYRYVPGFSDLIGKSMGIFIQGTIADQSGKYERNDWICGTPSEFQKKLRDLLAKEYIKSLIISLLTSENATSESTSQDKSPEAMENQKLDDPSKEDDPEADMVSE